MATCRNPDQWGKDPGLEAGVCPRRCEVLEQIAQQEDPEATVWTGSGVPTEQQGVRILGAPSVGAHRFRVGEEVPRPSRFALQNPES